MNEKSLTPSEPVPGLFFQRLSIRLKLVVLLGMSAFVALLISSSITLVSTFLTQRDESLQALHQLADVSSENLRAALAFSDPASAARLLQPLRANSHIRLAMVEDGAGQELSRFVAAGQSADDTARYLEQVHRSLVQHPPLTAPTDAISAVGFDNLLVVKPIWFEGQAIGRLTIVSDNQALRDKIVHHLLFQSVVSVVALALLLLISLPLQRLFTQPIFDLIASMRQVSQTKNYALRVSASQSDEFGSLYNGFNAMLAEVQDRDQMLSKLATTDALTGLANRGNTLETLDNMIVRARRKQEPVGVIMVDIDHFKRVNDTLGHAVGDIVLKEVAALLARSAREYDLVGRLGGEEFVVLCDNSDTANTLQIAERLRSSVARQACAYPGGVITVTVSLGVYACVPEAHSGAELLHRADLALYRAKNQGRNRVEVEVEAKMEADT